MKRLTIAIALVIAVVVPAAPASADVFVEGAGEPAFTKSNQNTQWVRWQAPSGVGAYRLRINYYENNALVKQETYNAPLTGTTTINWVGVRASLQEGSTYGICVEGQYQFPNDSLWFPDSYDSCDDGVFKGKRTSTTIDRTAPTTSVSVRGGAATTRDASLPVRIDFTDATAGANPANFVCVKPVSDPLAACQAAGSFQQSAACSSPKAPGKSTAFECVADASGLPDGPVGVCVIAADASVPDNPTGPDQSGTATSANLSDAKCDTIVLDRAAPSVTITASSTAVTAGQAIAFAAKGTDATSGAASSISWDWADGTAAGSGDAVTHTFTQAGTYKVKARISDAAGNEGMGEVTVIVTAPPTPPQDDDPSDPAPDDSPDEQPVDPQPTNPQPATPGSVQGGLSVLVPKKFRVGTARRNLVIGTTADRAGVLSLQLVRKGRVIAAFKRSIEAGSAKRKLRLPRKPRVGRYTLKVSFSAGEAQAAATRSYRIEFVR